MQLKKFIALFTAVLLSISTLSALASDAKAPVFTEITKAEQVGEEWKICIEGSSKQPKGTVVILNLLYPGVNPSAIKDNAGFMSQVGYMDTTTVGADGTFSFVVPLKAKDPGGTFNAYVNVPGEAKPISFTVPCMNYARRNGSLSSAESGETKDILKTFETGIGDLNAVASFSYLNYDDSKKEYVANYVIYERENWLKDEEGNENDADAKLTELGETIGEVVLALDNIKKLSGGDRELIDTMLAAELADLQKGGNGTMLLKSDLLANLTAYGNLAIEKKEKAIVKLDNLIGAMVYPEDLADGLKKAVEYANTEEETFTPIGGNTHQNPINNDNGTVKTDDDFIKDNTKEELNEAVDSFSDLSGASWASNEINTLAARGIVAGRGDGKFYPNDSITRAEFLTLLVNVFNLSLITEKNLPFKDVAFENWYYEAVQITYSRGITNGVSADEFGVNEPITRQDMAVLISRTISHLNMKFPSSDVNYDFTDKADIASYAKSAVQTFANAGIINGVGDGRFAPTATATRAQTATIIYRIMSSLKLL